jgi:hypothetical protein
MDHKGIRRQNVFGPILNLFQGGDRLQDSRVRNVMVVFRMSSPT